MDIKNNTYILPFSILGISLIIGVIILASTWSSNYKSNQTITVTGSAKKVIVSDFGMLKGTLNFRGLTQLEAYQGITKERPLLINFIKSKGFTENDFEFEPVSSNPYYETTTEGTTTKSKIVGYDYIQNISIKSNDVNKIKSLAMEIPGIIEQGVRVNFFPPEYLYSKIGDVKVEIQSEAAKNAFERAEKIASATGGSLGPLRGADMGVLQITPKYSNEVSAEGINDLSSIEKVITAVVNATFQVK